MNRREFTQMAGLAAAAVSLPAAAGEAKPVKFKKSLAGGAIGVSANLNEAVDYAARFGFGAVAPNMGELLGMTGLQRNELLAKMREKDIAWGAAGLPVQFRTGEDAFEEGIEKLPAMAKALGEAGGKRVITYLLPSHDELTYRENFRIHRRRLRECARILNGEGLRFGLEFVGPQTSLTAKRYPFLHTQKETMELVEAIDLPGVGILMDSWHWYTSRGTKAELYLLNNEQVVDVQVNDAPAGLALEEQMDLSRELPCATGVIPLDVFMQFLVDIGYDGPISCEPFNKELNDMDNEAALAATAESLNKLFALVGA